jgi:hypothetical protein
MFVGMVSIWFVGSSQERASICDIIASMSMEKIREAGVIQEKEVIRKGVAAAGGIRGEW